MADRVVQLRRREHMGSAGQVIEQRRCFVEEQGQVVLDARRRNALGDILIDRGVLVGVGKLLKPAASEPRAGFLVPRKFVGRQQFDPVNAIDGSLALRVKGAQGFNLVIEEVDPVGLAGSHGKDVENCPANGIFAMLVDILRVPVSGGFQLHPPAGNVQGLADFQ